MPTFNFSSPDGQSYQIEGPEGATEAQAFQILKQQMLRPAYKDKSGKVVAGLPGERHDDMGEVPEDQRGFVDLKGNFLGREEASKVAKSMGMDVPDVMHTSDLNSQTGIGTTEKPKSDSGTGKSWLSRHAESVGTGLKDIAVGAQQIGAHLAPASSDDPFIDQDMLAKAQKEQAAKTDQQVTEREKGIQAERAARNETGTDWWRVGGNIAGTLPLAALNPLAAGAASGALTPVTDGNFALEKAKQIGLGAVAGKAGEIGGNMLARVLTPEAGAVAKAAAANPIFEEARKVGYVIHPADATKEPGAVANTLAGLGGKIKTQQLASVRNQSVTNSIAAKELGLAPDAMLDETTFSAVRKEAGKAYKAVEDSLEKLPSGTVRPDKEFREAIANLGPRTESLRADFPELANQPEIEALQKAVNKGMFSPKSGVEAIKRLRFQAKSNLKSFDNPEKVELGMAQRDAANALEDLMERRLVENGDAKTVQAYRDARQLIAKSHDIEAATDSAGNVDARKIARLSDKRPFTGGLKTIADTAEAFPKSMQNPGKFGGNEKLSVLDMGAMIGSLGASVASGNPLVAAGALAPLARPLARSAALSEGIQNRLAGLNAKPALGLGAIPLQTRNELAALSRGAGSALAPALGGGANAVISP